MRRKAGRHGQKDGPPSIFRRAQPKGKGSGNSTEKGKERGGQLKLGPKETA